jgi:hypothetical protein
MIFRLLLVSACLLGNELPVTANQENASGLLGTGLASARANSDYFQFFNLSPATDLQASSGEQVFKPGGDFRQLVTIYVKTNAQQIITGIRAVVARSFIEDPVNGVYARDFVNSTLRSAGNTGDAAKLEELITEIHYRDIKRIMLSGREPHLSATPSAGYLVFSGASSSWEINLSSGKIRLSNETMDNRKSLVITVETR